MTAGAAVVQVVDFITLTTVSHCRCYVTGIKCHVVVVNSCVDNTASDPTSDDDVRHSWYHVAGALCWTEREWRWCNVTHEAGSQGLPGGLLQLTPHHCSSHHCKTFQFHTFLILWFQVSENSPHLNLVHFCATFGIHSANRLCWY